MTLNAASGDYAEMDMSRPQIRKSMILLCQVLATFGALAVMISGFGRFFDVVIAWGLFSTVIFAAAWRPTAAVPAIYLVYVSNRLIRRLLDYTEGAYTQLPPTSMVVPMLGITFGIIALQHWSTLPRPLRRGSVFFGLAVLYGSVIGLPFGSGMVFEAISWLSPLGFGLYVAWLRPDMKLVRQWIAMLGLITVVAMVYGWVQWRLLPPWDQFWVANCGMGSIGQPEAGKTRFFGSFGAMGGAGSAAAWSAALLVMARALPMTQRWPIVVFLAISSLATQVRSAWIAAVGAVAAWLILGKSRHRVPVIAGLAVALIAMMYVLPKVPQSEALVKRAGTLQNISSDGSLHGRIEFTIWAISETVRNPVGHGLGSTSVMSVHMGMSEMTAFDSGYAQPPFALGVPGTLLFIAGMWYFLRPIFQRQKGMARGPREMLELAKAVVIGHAFAMVVSNFMRNENAMLFWVFVALGHVAIMAKSASATSAYEPADASNTDVPSSENRLASTR